MYNDIINRKENKSSREIMRTADRLLEFVQSRPEIYSCADIACDYSSRLKNALESMKNQLSGYEASEA